jgi:ribosomal protein L11 methylase PrmA
MFAARAGAKHVFAIDASDIALKARQNVKDNGLEDIITSVEIPIKYFSISTNLPPTRYSTFPVSSKGKLNG